MIWTILVIVFGLIAAMLFIALLLPNPNQDLPLPRMDTITSVDHRARQLNNEIYFRAFEEYQARSARLQAEQQRMWDRLIINQWSMQHSNVGSIDSTDESLKTELDEFYKLCLTDEIS